MKKIGIISLYYMNFNYGGMLQAFALTKAIETLGYYAEQVSIKRDRYKKIKKSVNAFCVPLKICRKLVSVFFENKLKVRNEKFRTFMNYIPHSEACYTWKTIFQAREKYDGFICGSDQVWNPNYFTMEESVPYTLEFVDDKQVKFSYAASVGVSELTKERSDALNKAVEKLNYISLREESAKSLFEEKIRSEIEVVLDPTFLLNANEWKKEENAVDIPKKYIFCYFLGKSRSNRKMARAVSQKMGIPIVTCPYISKGSELADIGFGDVKALDVGPKEFLYLIHHAELILTDSFHACAFSLQFKRPFLAFSRDDKENKTSMNSRIYDFATKFHLERQLMLGEKRPFNSDCMKIDWTTAYEVLEKEREKSMEFLRNALSEVND